MILFKLLILFFVFLAIEIFYFKIADKYNIIDKPNERSSHTQITIRGGGIIFPIAWMFYSIMHGFVFPYITIGVILVSVISFLDDRMNISSKLRLLIHLLAFTACFYELNLFSILPFWALAIVYIVSIGCVNAINFMDGINGMTGLYGLAILMPLQYYFFETTLSDNFLVYIIISILVFGIFNFRKKAKCFAGDVGSISLGYLLIFIILGLMFNLWSKDGNQLVILTTSNNIFDIKYLLLLALYGVDSISTIIQRIYLRENIFMPHRRHLYQLLANEYKWNHILVSSIYASFQLLISIIVMYNKFSALEIIYVLIILIILYVSIKRFCLKK